MLNQKPEFNEDPIILSVDKNIRPRAHQQESLGSIVCKFGNTNSVVYRFERREQRDKRQGAEKLYLFL